MNRVIPWLATAWLLVLWAVVTHFWSVADVKPAQAADESSGPNAACYACHLTFVHEKMAKLHQAEKIGCTDCHGLSAKHVHDAQPGTTPPDIVFKRDKVDAACSKCHKTHNAPATQVVARFLQRKLPAEPAPICTDCHGLHRIEREAKKKEGNP